MPGRCCRQTGMRHTLGLRPPVRPHGLEDLKVYASGKLPPAPATVPAPKVFSWGMDGNDQHGDCAMAGAAHDLLAWGAILDALGHKAVVPVPPTQAQGVEQYKKLTGCVTPGDSHDLGLVLSDVLKVWQQEGLFAGNKPAAYAPVDHTSVLDIHQAVAAYGVSYSGVALPESAEEQFNAGGPWTVVGDQPVGGHCATPPQDLRGPREC